MRINVFFGEQPRKRALASDGKYAISKELNFIQTGLILTCDKAILANAFFSHYRKRFIRLATQSHPGKLRRFLFHVPTLSDADKISIETPTGLTDIEDAIGALPPGCFRRMPKILGSNQISVNFLPDSFISLSPEL